MQNSVYPDEKGPGYGQNGPVVVTGQPQHIVVVQQGPAEPWTWCPMVVSAIGFILCPVFGLVALISALMSYADHRIGDHGAWRSKKRCSLGFGITALVLGGIICLGYIAYWCHVFSEPPKGGKGY